jgi:hypothetical protein
MNQWIAAAFLVALGTVHMIGDLSSVTPIKALGAATQASPAPKVFTSQSGFETFSARFFIDWQDTSGLRHTMEVTPQNYRRLQGPYNRRNAYGAALSYGPVLAANERTRPMLELVMNHAFCGEAPVLEDLGIPKREIAYPLIVRLEPRREVAGNSRWQTSFRVGCEAKLPQAG